MSETTRIEACPCGELDCIITLPPISYDEGNSYESPCGRLVYWHENHETGEIKLHFSECEVHGYLNRQFSHQAKPVCTCE